MEDSLKEFYKSLDSNTFKYFVKDGCYFVYENDLKFISGSKSGYKVEEHVLEKAIREALTLHKVKVEEYENFELKKEGYPGNWKDFTDILLDKAMPPSICAVSLEGNLCHFAFLNTLDNFIYTSTFEDDDIYSNLCGFVTEINAFELIYYDLSLESVILSLGILSHKTKRLKALDSLITFLKIDIPKIKEYIRPNICRLENNTLESLNIIKLKKDDKFIIDKCVVDTFNCSTIQGHRLLLHFIKYPLKSKEEIEYRLSIVDNLRNLDLSVLKIFPDLLRITKRIQNYKITIQEIIRIHQVFNKVPNLLEQINTKNLRKDFYTPLLGLCSTLKEIQDKIEESVDLEASSRNIYRMKMIESDLKEKMVEFDLRECYGQIQEKIKNEYKRILKINDKVKYEEVSNLFRISRSEYRQTEDVFKRNNILVTNVLKTGVQFTTKTLSELNNERESILEKIKKEEKIALESLKEFIKERCSEIEVLNYLIALLDVFNAFSLKANTPGYSKPVIGGNEIILKDLFHPLLENNQYIPNDLNLKNEKMMIITGPNMGGKSTFLKSVALISILGQIGCYVPAYKACIPIYDGIFVRMGASDCTYTGDSTFMLEMKDISRIVRRSTASTLVLIDELGRGTSEIDGLSLALAVKDFLLKKNCVTLFATHFPELCEEKKGILTKRVLVEGTLLLYKIEDGVCDESFGINVAKKVGFPQDVLDEIEQ